MDKHTNIQAIKEELKLCTSPCPYSFPFNSPKICCLCLPIISIRPLPNPTAHINSRRLHRCVAPRQINTNGLMPSSSSSDQRSRKTSSRPSTSTTGGQWTLAEDAAFVRIRELMRSRSVLLSNQQLGIGSYSRVFRATYRGAPVAVKMIDTRIGGEYVRRFMQRELDIICGLDHDHIIKVYKIFRTHEFVAIVEELAHGGDLLGFMRTKPKGYLTEAEARPLFRQLILAVHYLESQQIVHRDIKCENLFLDAENNIKLGDFGFSRVLRRGELSRTHCGSKTYAALEILAGRSYTGNGVDIWSSGIVLYCILTGNFPFGGNTDQVELIVAKQRARNLRFPSRLSEEVRDLIRWMLHPDPAQRARTDQILRHTWLTGPEDYSDSEATTGI